MKRILIVGNKRFFYKNTHLFSVAELKDDNKYYIDFHEDKKSVSKNPPDDWKSIFSHERKVDKDEMEYSTGCPKKEYTNWFGVNGNNIDSIKELKEILQDRKFHKFSAKRDNNYRISLFEYYLKYLHSPGEAKILILKEDEEHQNIFGLNLKTYKSIHKNQLNLDSFNLDSGYIKIGDKELILNTYMDTFNNIVKLKIIESTEGESFLKLKRELDDIINRAKPIVFKGTSSKNEDNFHKVKAPKT